jgi:rod shape-determining protein MreD
MAMAEAAIPRGTFFLYLTIILGLMLQVFPLPHWADQLRPQWPLLILIYWSMALPHRCGIFTALIVGLFVDVMLDDLLGHHALAYSLAIYVVMTTYKRLRLTPMWQQAVAVFLLLMIERIVSAIVLGATRGQATDALFWLSPLIGMLLWPWLFILLRDLRRKFRMQ